MLTQHRAASGTSELQSAQKVCTLREQSLEERADPMAKERNLLEVIQFFSCASQSNGYSVSSSDVGELGNA
jgi:hypothetical protein